jgi:hypothetical protein
MQKNHVRRKRAAWRFEPKLLEDLQRFAAQQDPRTTQTAVIEAALREYMNRKQGSRQGVRR